MIAKIGTIVVAPVTVIDISAFITAQSDLIEVADHLRSIINVKGLFWV